MELNRHSLRKKGKEVIWKGKKEEGKSIKGERENGMRESERERRGRGRRKRISYML